ncbi:MarR family 2-MHQ and catechol resistance regulon transcriptional repressor [Neobacillus niacini]|uniref:MarR family winged helix-turn-helix transcriptional regulator n=1 Tax=Neobacillus niacini TaxID=86668 RepID=UPI0027836867|nr:MarR family transcriptional regulator [Neobacillus niacini]MDQ1004637.1 MarR family 2-MHQ and catechol resistance regulon transcriptional repressor [Neobacillus niacini]
MERKCSNQPFLLLMQTSKAIQERIRDEMSINNLSITEFSVLEVLYYQGKQTIQQIGNRILISSGSMTYVIDKLEEKGIIKRNDCKEDRRVIHITLTADGMELMKNIMPKYQEMVDSFFEDITDDESMLMINFLKKVQAKVKS